MNLRQMISTKDTESDVDQAYEVGITFCVWGRYNLTWFHITTYWLLNEVLIVILYNRSLHSNDWQESRLDKKLGKCT